MKCYLRPNIDFVEALIFIVCMCQTKLCTNCTEEKKLEFFGKSKRTKDGKQHQCKDCVNFKRRVRNSSREILEYKDGGIKVCIDCKTEKTFSCFSNSKESLDGKMSQCKECRTKYHTPKREGVVVFSDESRRVCTKCNKTKDFSEFNKTSKNIIGVTSICKSCKKEQRILQKDKQKVVPTYKICTKCEVEKSKNAFVKDVSKPDGLSCVCKPCTNSHKRERLKTDFTFRTSNNVRKIITAAFKKCVRGLFTKNIKTEDIINISFLDLRLNIEKQFSNWMSWSNYGIYDGSINVGFDIDHIIPISYAKTEEEIYLLNHWSNFQPLCSKVNRDIKKAIVYPCTNLELGITFWEDRWEYTNLD